jgi:hypothetical protein
MLPLLRWTGLCVLLTAFVIPTFAADEKKDAKKTDEKSAKTKDSKDGKEKEEVPDYVVVGTVDGVVKEVSARSISLTVITREPDPAAIQRLGQLQAQMAQHQATANKNNGFNLQALANDRVQIAQQQVAVNKGIEKKIEKQFENEETIKVRIAEPPLEFDGKGKRKTLTKDEITKLKGGNAKAWGFPAEFDQVASGQTVKIYLGVKKSLYEAAKKKKPAATTKKKKDEPEDFEDAPTVRVIHIMDLGKK